MDLGLLGMFLTALVLFATERDQGPGEDKEQVKLHAVGMSISSPSLMKSQCCRLLKEKNLNFSITGSPSLFICHIPVILDSEDQQNQF